MKNKKEIRDPYLIRETIFNRIMSFTRKVLYFILRLDRHKNYDKKANNRGYIPLLSYNYTKKTYRFNCYCFSCPCNSDGLCMTQFQSIPLYSLHEFDGDNILRNFCG